MRLIAAVFATALIMISAPAGAEIEPAPIGKAEASTGPALELNVLWPFFPGGLSDFKILVPVLRATERNFRGEAVLGLHSDFGWRSTREEDAGKVAILAVKAGYRQFLFSGLHLDLTVNMGWRQEHDNPFDQTTLNGFVGRLWAMAGYQHDLSERWYLNARGGVGIHLWRTDRFGHEERPLAPAGDINVGVRF